jgi:hypothetical protein
MSLLLICKVEVKSPLSGSIKRKYIWFVMLSEVEASSFLNSRFFTSFRMKAFETDPKIEANGGFLYFLIRLYLVLPTNERSNLISS